MNNDNLKKLLLQKDHVLDLIKQLAQSKLDNKVTETEYDKSLSSLHQDLNLLDAQIIGIKTNLHQQLESNSTRLQTLNIELNSLEEKFKTLQISTEDYQKSAMDIRTKISNLTEQNNSIQVLIDAATAAAPSIIEKPLPVANRVPSIPQKWWIVIGGAAAALVIVVLIVLLMTIGGGSSVIKVPVTIEKAKNLGSLHIEFIYDSNIFTAVSVEKGPIVSDALFNYSINTPGDVIIGLVSSQGIEGDGAIAVVTLKSKAAASTESLITLENITAYTSNLSKLPSIVAAGSVKTTDNSLTPPGLTFDTQ
jgi:hypothetical protein